MVYAFECERCQVRVYSARATRARGCPMCAEPMQRVPVVERGRTERPARPARLEVRSPATARPA